MFFGCCFFGRAARHAELPQPGIKPAPHGVEAPNLNHWTAREVPGVRFLNQSCSNATPTVQGTQSPWALDSEGPGWNPKSTFSLLSILR